MYLILTYFEGIWAPEELVRNKSEVEWNWGRYDYVVFDSVEDYVRAINQNLVNKDQVLAVPVKEGY